ncbi:YfdX family protein [Accumulibacter sp.]|uniref:YfdX family protein n=1 Tax=Accumulibacter sp. TaxID=2053492 RepID=UPI0026027AEB|nr:YfdX family protein [Accumulibacter sp.]
MNNDKNSGETRTSAVAADLPTPEKQSALTQAVQGTIDQVVSVEQDDKRKQIINEALKAVDETKKALSALSNQQTAEALEALAIVTGKLEVLIARDPKLALAPVEVHTIVHDLFAGPGTITDIIEEAEYALKHGEVQEARHLLSRLASEVVIQTTHLPLGTYPQAIKAVVPLLDEGKIDEAKAALEAVLGSLVVTNVTIPLPIERARALFKEAESLMEQAERSDADGKRLLDMLGEARNQIEIAELLGYGRRKEEFKDLYDHLKELEKQASAGKMGTGFFEEVTASFKGLFERWKPSSERQTERSNATCSSKEA